MDTKAKASNLQKKLTDVMAEAKAELDKALEKHQALHNQRDVVRIARGAAKAKVSNLEKKFELSTSGETLDC